MAAAAVSTSSVHKTGVNEPGKLLLEQCHPAHWYWCRALVWSVRVAVAPAQWTKLLYNSPDKLLSECNRDELWGTLLRSSICSTPCTRIVYSKGTADVVCFFSHEMA